MVVGNTTAVDQRDTALGAARTGRAAIHSGCKQIHLTENVGGRRRGSARNHRAVGGELPVGGHTAGAHCCGQRRRGENGLGNRRLLFLADR